MARKKEFTPQEIIKALEDANGIQAVAARVLGTSRQTIMNYIKDDPKVKAAYDVVNETTIDWVEGKLYEQVKGGNITAIIFYLKTKAKHRGYVERQEVTGKDGKDLVTVYIPKNNRDSDA